MRYTSSERPPEAVDRTNFPSECRSNASTSSSEMKSSNVITGGSLEISCGEYCKKKIMKDDKY